MLGPAAVSRINAHDIETGAQSLLRRAEHVTRFGRAFHPVKQHKRRPRPAVPKPRAMGQHLNPLRRVEVASLGVFHDKFEATRDQRARERLRVRVSQLGRGNKRRAAEVLEYALFRHRVSYWTLSALGAQASLPAL